MAYSLTWLPEVLEKAGLKTNYQPKWDTRGHSEMGPVKGVICHHTGSHVKHKSKVMPSLDGLTYGVTDTNGKFHPGPLAQLGLARDGTYHIIAAGLSNHAGKGNWKGIVTGNTNFIGIEAENVGNQSDDPWPDVQVDAYIRGVAAILKHVNASSEMCCGHKEWRPTGQKAKIDPHTIDMDEFRSKVADVMNGGSVRPRIAAKDDQGRPTLRRGDSGDKVKEIQKALNLTEDGVFGAKTEATLREFQREKNLVPDGIAGPITLKALLG